MFIELPFEASLCLIFSIINTPELIYYICPWKLFDNHTEIIKLLGKHYVVTHKLLYGIHLIFLTLWGLLGGGGIRGLNDNVKV